MARKNKQGLDYFPYDVDLDQDDKLGMIIAEFGVKGELFYTKLCCFIYKHKGYFTEWNEESQLKFLRRYNYCGFSMSFMGEIIPRLIKWDLFDKVVFDSFQILTSSRIQETYLSAARKRNERIIDPRFLLKMDNSGKRTEEIGFPAEEMSKTAEEVHKGKERKLKERREENATSILPEINAIQKTFDAEQSILENSTRFEQVCMKTYKSPELAKTSLRKYHLFLTKKEEYPKSIDACFAGFEMWLMNEKNFPNQNVTQTTPIVSYGEKKSKQLLEGTYGPDWQSSASGKGT